MQRTKRSAVSQVIHIQATAAQEIVLWSNLSTLQGHFSLNRIQIITIREQRCTFVVVHHSEIKQPHKMIVDTLRQMLQHYNTILQ